MMPPSSGSLGEDGGSIDFWKNGMLPYNTRWHHKPDNLD